MENKIFFAQGHAAHDCAGEIKDGKFAPCFENPRRLESIRTALVSAGLSPGTTAADFGFGPILDVHDPAYVAFLRDAHRRWRAAGRAGDILPLVWPGVGMRAEPVPATIDGQVGLYCFDVGTPLAEGTWQAAYEGAQIALAAAESVLGGARRAFACARPPGHHAMRAQYGGYCFLNNAAIAAQYFRTKGARRVAVLDVDYHHGNGTQAAFYDRPDVLVVNLHADPRSEYPYYLGHADEDGVEAGRGYNLNLPLAKGTDWAAYAPALARGIDAIRAFAPDFLVLSYGADTFEDDPLGRMKLKTGDYAVMGAAIAALGLPIVTVMEGGYAIEALGANVVSLLGGLGYG